MRKVLFLDRDGVINVEKNYLYRIEEFEFIESTLTFMKIGLEFGYEIVIVTNQAGIAKGKYTEKDYHVLNQWMISELNRRNIPILATYFSPYHKDGIVKEYAIDHFTRKPNPGMLLQAKEDFDIDMSKSIMVGDRFSDVLAGFHAGVGKLYLIEAPYNYRDYQPKDYPNAIFEIVKNTKEIPLF